MTPGDERVLADRMRQLERLQRRMNHDLRGSLNVLGLQLDLLNTSLEGTADDRQRKCLTLLRRELTRLQGDCARMMALLRRWDEAPAPVDVAHVVGDVTELTSGVARAKGVALRAGPAEPSVLFPGHGDALTHAVLTLTLESLGRAGQDDGVLLQWTADDSTVTLEWHITRAAAPEAVPAAWSDGALDVVG